MEHDLKELCECLQEPVAHGEVKGLLRRCTQQGGLRVVVLDLCSLLQEPMARD